MIQVEDLVIRLPGFTLGAVSFRVAAGEFFTLLGPTGAGKTLILEAIAGMVPVHAGRIRIGGRDVTRLPPEQRRIGIVYQDQALFPHLSVRENIRFGLRYRSRSADSETNIGRLIERLGLTRLVHRGVVNLSGGERQRVALARALAVAPDILLLDEPLSALDPNFREEIRDLLKKLHQDSGLTVLMVTHDFAEAHFLAARAAVLGSGRIEQMGSMADVFHHPASPAVAAFVGMKNIFPARFDRDRAAVGSVTLCLGRPVADTAGHVAVRPEDIHLHGEAAGRADGAVNGFSGQVRRIDHQGVFCEVRVRCQGLVWQTLLPTGRVLAEGIVEGARVWLRVDAEKIHVMCADAGAGGSPGAGSRG